MRAEQRRERQVHFATCRREPRTMERTDQRRIRPGIGASDDDRLRVATRNRIVGQLEREAEGRTRTDWRERAMERGLDAAALDRVLDRKPWRAAVIIT